MRTDIDILGEKAVYKNGACTLLFSHDHIKDNPGMFDPMADVTG